MGPSRRAGFLTSVCTLTAAALTACSGGSTTSTSSTSTFPEIPSGYHVIFRDLTGTSGVGTTIPSGNASISVVGSCVGTGEVRITFGTDGSGLTIPCDPKGNLTYVTGAVITPIDPSVTTMTVTTGPDNTWHLQVSGSARTP